MNNLNLDLIKKIHFIGIGGCGMSALALILNKLEFSITGSDLYDSYYTELLKKNKIKFTKGHYKFNIYKNNPEIIVKSSIINDDNIEIITAKKNKIPIYHRSQILNYICNLHQKIIGIMGSNGKGTTAGAIINCLSIKYNLNYILGAILEEEKTNYNFKKENNIIIIEIDESDGSFFNLFPNYLIINNIDLDHIEYLKSIENTQNLFIKYIESNKSLEKVFINIENKESKVIFNYFKDKKKSFRLIPALDDYKILNLKKVDESENYSKFNLNNKTFVTPLFTRYNIENLVMALTVGIDFDCNTNDLFNQIKKYNGLKDRFNLIKKEKNIYIIKVFAHCSYEIGKTLDYIRISNLPICVVYKPFGSINYLKKEIDYFKKTFFNIDKFVLCPHNNNLVNIFLRKKLDNSYYINNKEELINYLQDNINKDYIIVFFSVNKLSDFNIFDVADKLVF